MGEGRSGWRRGFGAAPNAPGPRGFGAPRTSASDQAGAEHDAGLAKPGFGGSVSPESTPGEPHEVVGEATGAGGASRGRRRRADDSPAHPRHRVASLGVKARVVRDGFGIPHIEAKQERDGYAALGFCMAEDRLFQLDLLRRLALGRAAEVLGPAFARQDALVRTAGVARRAAAAATRLQGGAREVLAAFVGGLNAVVAERSCPEAEALGYRPSPWTLADCLALELYAAWGLGRSGWSAKLALARAVATAGLDRVGWLVDEPIARELAEAERLALLRRIDPRLPDLVAAPELGGGRAWAVAPAPGEAGGTLAAAPALPATFPPLGYLVHIEAGALSAAGVALVGTPALVLARNRRCAWAAIGVSLDDADWVLEDLDGIGKFRTEAGWERLARRREIVRVRGGDDLSLEVLETRNGPILSHLLEELQGPRPVGERPVPVALRWGIHSLGSSIEGWLALARARTLDEVGAAAQRLERGPLALGLVAADDAGRVGRWAVGALPRRAGSARLPVRGWAGEARWQGAASLAAQPSETPPRGVAMAPARPPRRAASSTVDAAEERELRFALERRPSPSEQWALLRDEASEPVLDEIGPILFRAVAGSPELAGLLGGIKAEGLERRRAAAVVVRALREHLVPDMFPEERFGNLARSWRLVARALPRILASGSSPWFPDEAARDEALRRALRGTLARAGMAADGAVDGPMAAVPGADLLRGIALAAAPGGDSGTWPAPGAAISLGPEGPVGPWNGESGVAPAAAFRALFELGSTRLRAVLPGGQGGRPGAPHFADQLSLWVSGQAVEIELGKAPEGEVVELVPG